MWRTLLLLFCFPGLLSAQQAGDLKVLPLPQDIALKLRYVPPGTFVMGSDSSDAFYQGDEFPAHPVTLTRGFYLGQFEVTQEQWEAVMGENPSVFDRYPTSPRHPVDMISWDDCQVFLERINALGLPGRFRLPTEAEWEYACRAGTQTLFYWGDGLALAPMLQHAWFYSRAAGRSHLVGEKRPNAWQLYDMSGGVWEWCQDWRGPYEAGPKTDPQGPATGTRRIYRGGSWFNEPEALRSANRHGHPPATRGTNSGLRLLWEPGE